MEERQILSLAKSYVEGTISIDNFKELYNNREVQEYFSKMPEVYGTEFNDLNSLILKHKWSNFLYNFIIQLNFSYLLKQHGIEHEMSDRYELMKENFNKIFPDWLSDDAISYIEQSCESIISSDMDTTEKKKLIRTFIKETFKYEKRPPQWVQEGNWPRDEEGNFLTFRSQKEDGDLVTYTFVNPKTGQEVQTQEFY